MPLPTSLDEFAITGVPECSAPDAVKYVRGLLSALNLLYGCVGCRWPSRCMNAMQRTALRTVGRRVSAYVDRLLSSDLIAAPGPASWEPFQSRGCASPLQLVAALVDCPDRAGTCDPLKLLPRKWTDVITDSKTMFPDPPAGLDRFSGFYAGDRADYVKLVLRQLRCGKTILCNAVRGGGTFFLWGSMARSASERFGMVPEFLHHARGPLLLGGWHPLLALRAFTCVTANNSAFRSVTDVASSINCYCLRACVSSWVGLELQGTS